MLVTMSDEKNSAAEPTVIFATSPASDNNAKPTTKSRLSKKSILIAVVSVLITGLVVTAVLVSIRLFTQNDLEKLKYSLQAKGISQNVSVDSDKNVVSYHVAKEGVEAWIVQDFDKGIQVSKVLVDGTTACYVSALNRSMATDASSIPDAAPDAAESAPSSSALYEIVGEPISDISYLGQKVSTMCHNIPTYHVVPECGKTPANTGVVMQNSTTSDHIAKRSLRYCDTCPYPYCLCICGCCWKVCANFQSIAAVSYYSGGVWWCSFYYYNLYSLTYFGGYNLPYCYYGGYNYYPV